MIKGDPGVGDEFILSYNHNVRGLYAGDDLVTFHDIDMSVSESIHEALLSKCDVEDPTAINLDSIFWFVKS